MSEELTETCELATFTCPECYVYKVPPARTSAGHRAQDWDVEKWLQAVRLKVVESGDACTVRLSDASTDELFAECPIPTDKPLFTSVEPVVDSSRYFCLQIVDTASGGCSSSCSAPRHAFIGLGFQDRAHAYDFTAALQDYRRRMDRQKEAQRIRDTQVCGESVVKDSGAQAANRNLALKEGEVIHINLNLGRNQAKSEGSTNFSSPSSSSSIPAGSFQNSDSSPVLSPLVLLSPPPSNSKTYPSVTNPPSIDPCCLDLSSDTSWREVPSVNIDDTSNVEDSDFEFGDFVGA